MLAPGQGQINLSGTTSALKISSNTLAVSLLKLWTVYEEGQLTMGIQIYIQQVNLLV